MQILDGMMPRRSRQVHRLLLQGAGRETLLTGHLELDRTAGFRAVALDELGGPAFGFVHCRERTEIVEAPPGLDLQVLRRGPVADLAAAFLLPETEPNAVSGAGARVAARWQLGETQLECSFDFEYGRVLSCEEGRNGRVLRVLSYHYGSVDHADRLVGIRVHDRALHFRMQIEILELRPLAPATADRDWCDPS